MAQHRSPNKEKIRALQDALDNYVDGSEPLIDAEHEKALSKVRERALLLLDQRSRSRHELQERLERAEFPAELIEEVLDALEGSGLVDDSAFAREWVRQRFKRRGKSAMALDLELKQKGVSGQHRAAALEQIDEDDEREIARALARKKARGVKVVPGDRAARDKELRRIVGVLARRGFNEGMALTIAREALTERCDALESAGAD